MLQWGAQHMGRKKIVQDTFVLDRGEVRTSICFWHSMQDSLGPVVITASTKESEQCGGS